VVDPLVSVIIPVFRVESFVEQCITSAMRQDYSNLEIIIVNDGSPDRSGEIVERLAETDPRLKVIHTENRGVASARNTGLDIAKGEFAVFIDSDDYIMSDYVSYMLKLIRQTDSDVAVSTEIYHSSNSRQVSTETVNCFTGEQAIEALYLYQIGVAVWNKIWRLSFINENKLRFNSFMSYGEGTTFCITAFQLTKRVGVGNRKILFMRDNPDSATRKLNIAARMHGLDNLEFQREHLTLNSKRVKNAWRFHYWRTNCSNLKDIVRMSKQGEHAAAYSTFRRNIRRHALVCFLVPAGWKHRILALLMLLSPNLASHVWLWSLRN
jgi:glycosyltransferase involved in cell wall biosynthesis